MHIFETRYKFIQENSILYLIKPLQIAAVIFLIHRCYVQYSNILFFYIFSIFQLVISADSDITAYTVCQIEQTAKNYSEYWLRPVAAQLLLRRFLITYTHALHAHICTFYLLIKSKSVPSVKWWALYIYTYYLS